MNNSKVRVTRFFDYEGNYHEAFVREVSKSEINFLFDEYIASVEMTDGVYFEIYSVDGELCGFYEEA